MTDDQLKECREAFDDFAWNMGHNWRFTYGSEAWLAWQAAWSAHLPNPQPVVSLVTIQATLKDFGEAWYEENDVADYTFEQFQEAQAKAIYALQLPAHQPISTGKDPLGWPVSIFNSVIHKWWETRDPDDFEYNLRNLDYRLRELIAPLLAPAPQAPQIEGVVEALESMTTLLELAPIVGWPKGSPEESVDTLFQETIAKALKIGCDALATLKAVQG